MEQLGYEAGWSYHLHGPPVFARLTMKTRIVTSVVGEQAEVSLDAPQASHAGREEDHVLASAVAAQNGYADVSLVLAKSTTALALAPRHGGGPSRGQGQGQDRRQGQSQERVQGLGLGPVSGSGSGFGSGSVEVHGVGSGTWLDDVEEEMHSVTGLAAIGDGDPLFHADLADSSLGRGRVQRPR